MKKIKEQDRKNIPKRIPERSTNDETVSFVIDVIHIHHNYRLCHATPTEKIDFLDKLLHCGKMTWHDIIHSDRLKSGVEQIRIDQLSSDPLLSLTPDETIYVFHVRNLYRIVGIRRGREFIILFIDPKGECYKH